MFLSQAFHRYPQFQGMSYYFYTSSWSNGDHISRGIAGRYDIMGYDVETGKLEGSYAEQDAKWKHCDLMTVVDGTVYCKVMEKNTATTLILGNNCQ
ncbi:hypothetical protein BCR44DRAFT_1438039 [Catenaria anguillulae PL171]|uniref:Uncharacterized protein n=1 Tax=Catenaria anguillulae PL171 TaxID=765915 RepID=A0A1Y2HIE8_9FUNG|nr:hypothetical protein BCR44DRAFT_1438039 [Catenaria anguillulae PL171]